MPAIDSRRFIHTGIENLVSVIDESAENDDEAFALIERLLDQHSDSLNSKLENHADAWPIPKTRKD